jgi:predicted Rossmann-fold nucleotide-binding protein
VLDLHTKPVVLLDPDGHYAGLLTWLHGLVDGGFALRSAMDRLVVTGEVGAALDACASAP